MEANIIYLFIAIFFAWYNGVLNLWGLEHDYKKKARYSKFWHTQGWIIRALLAVVVTIQSTLFWGWIMVIALWHCFDIIINLTMGHPWHYSGTVAFSDQYSTYTWAAKALYLIAGSAFLHPWLHYSKIIGIWLGIFTVAFIISCVLYWLRKPTLNKTILKISTVVILVLAGLLLLALHKEGILFTGSSKTYF